MMNKRKGLADYTNEDSKKILDSYALIEAIHEFFDPTTDHDFDYLEKRISLLRETYNLGKNSSNENSKIIDELLSGMGQLPSLRILPFDGALEVPDTLDSEAHLEIYKQQASKIDEIQESFHKIQRAYITYIVIHAIEGRLRGKTVTLGELIAAGLPEFDPGSDPLDY